MLLENKEEIEKAASSKAIKKTISEIEALLDGERVYPDGELRQKLHQKLYELLVTEVKFWYRRGFERGHKTCRKECAKVPKTIRRRMRLYTAYFPEKGTPVMLNSTLKDDL